MEVERQPGQQLSSFTGIRGHQGRMGHEGLKQAPVVTGAKHPIHLRQKPGGGIRLTLLPELKATVQACFTNASRALLEHA